MSLQRPSPCDIFIIDANLTVRRILQSILDRSGLRVFAADNLQELHRLNPDIAPGALLFVNVSGDSVALIASLRARLPAYILGQMPTLIATSIHPEHLTISPSAESFDQMLLRPFKPATFIDLCLRFSGALSTGRASLDGLEARLQHTANQACDANEDWSTVTALLRAGQSLPPSAVPINHTEPTLPSLEVSLDDDHLPAALPSPHTPAPFTANTHINPASSAASSSGSEGLPSIQGALQLWPLKDLLKHVQHVGFHGILDLSLVPSQPTHRFLLLDGRLDCIEPLVSSLRRPLAQFLLDAGLISAQAAAPFLQASFVGDDAQVLAQLLASRALTNAQHALDALTWQTSAYLWDVLKAPPVHFSLRALAPPAVHGLLHHRPRLQLDLSLLLLDFFRRSPHVLAMWRPSQGQRLYRNDGIAQLFASLHWPPEEQWVLAILSESLTFDGLMERAIDDGLDPGLVQQAVTRLHDFDIISPVRIA